MADPTTTAFGTTAIVMTPEEKLLLEDIQGLVDDLVDVIYNDVKEKGNSLPQGPAYQNMDTNFGAYYDQPAPNNIFSTSAYNRHSEGSPITKDTDFELLRAWSLALNSDVTTRALDGFYFSEDEATELFQFLFLTTQISQKAGDWIDDHPPTIAGSEDSITADIATGESIASADGEAPEAVTTDAPPASELFGDDVSSGSITAPEIDCSDPEQPEPEPDCPPPCQNDPRAASPNWTRLTEREPFLNSKTCEYSISVRTKYEAAPLEDLYSDPDYLQIGVEKLLDHYGKMMEPYDDENGVRIDPVELCMEAGTIKETFVSTRPYVKMKALVVVPYDTFNSIEEQGQPEEMPDRKGQPAFVTIKGEDFIFMSRQVARAMDIMAVRQAEWFFNAGGQLSEATFNLKEEADRVRMFVKEMRNLLGDNDFKLRKPMGQSKKWVEEFEIGFNEDMGVDYVKAVEKSCEKSEMLTKSFSSFKNSEPQTLPRTMYFVSQLPEMQADFTSADSISFDDFLRKYVAFPPVEVVVQAAGAQSLDPIWCPPPGQDTALTNFDLGDDLREIGKAIMDEVLSFPDAFANRFAEDMCATLEGKKKNDATFKDVQQLARQAADTAVRQFFAGDRFLSDLPRKLSLMTGGDPNDLYSKILDQLGLCGLLSLIEEALNCLLAGLGAEDTLKTMLNSVIGGMSQAVFEVLMLGLPADAKDQIRANLKEEFRNLPAPWDSDYRQGSYSGQGTKYTWGENPNAPSGQQGETVTTTTEITNEDGSKSVAEETTTDSEYKWYKPQKEVIVAGLPTTVGNTTGVVINEAAMGQMYGSSGTIGTAADKIADQVVDAYKEALLDLIDNNLIDLDMLKEQLTAIPGAQLFANIFKEMDCPPLPLFSPPLGNVLTTLELNLCPAHFAITLPKFNFDVSIGDIFKIIISVAKELVKELIVRLIILILKKILEIIFEALCALLELVGSAVIDGLTGGNALKNAIGGALCDDATDEDINQAMKQMLEATGATHCSGPDSAPSTEDASAFTEIAASMLTNQEVLDLLDGTATTQVKEMMSNVVADQIPSLACMTPSDIGTLFGALGKVVNPELIERAQMMDDLDTPVCESICASPEQLERFDFIRCEALKSKGLSPEECEEQLNALRERAKEDLADLANILNGGPFHNFPDFAGSDPVCPDSGDPFVPGGSILPEVPKALNDASTTAAKKIFDAIAQEHIDDLVGNRGFLDMVLSDSNGRGLQAHQTGVRSIFGTPLAEDLSFLQFYTDNMPADAGNSRSQLPENFGPDNGRGEKGKWLSSEVGTGGYPFTVASLLQQYFASYNENITFELLADGADTSEGPAYPMRGASIDFDQSSPRDGNYVRGIPWVDGEFELKYRDYAKDDKESYAMRMKVKSYAEVSPGLPSDEDISVIDVYENYENEGEELVTSYTVKSEASEETLQVLDTIEMPPATVGSSGFPQKLFAKLIASKLKELGSTNTTPLELALQTQWQYLCDVYMRKLSLLMASNKNGTISPPPNSFQYGYDTDQQIEKVYMGGEELDRKFFNDNREYYLRGDGTQATYTQATRDGDRDTDGPYIQAQILDRFGGSFKNPPWFERNPERDGWLGLTDRLVPEPDACDPLDGTEPREPICKFEDLQKMYSDLLNKYSDDKRLFMRPGSQCASPQPFNAIFSRGGAAGVDATIIAMIRIYVIEVMLRGTAMFSVFGPDCYDEILSTYIISHMDDDLVRMGVWGLPSKKFYYFFMEQIVQMYGRQVDLGEIEPTSDEQDALDYLNNYQMNNQFIAKGLFSKAVYNDRLGDIVQEALDLESSGEWTAGIRTLLSHFILREIKTMFKQFGENVYPDGAPIANVHSVVFNSPAFIQGSVQVGIPDVWNGLEAGESNIFEQDLIANYDGSSDDGSSVYPYLAGRLGNVGVGNHPFRLEKYIFLENYEPALGSLSVRYELPENLKNVASIEAFKEWATTQTDAATVPMTDIISSAKLGFRLVFKSSASERGDAEWGGDENTAIFYQGFRDATDGLASVSLEQKCLSVPVNQGRYAAGSLYAPDNPVMFMVPIVSAEMDLDVGQTLEEFAASIDNIVDDNQTCLLDEIANSGEYQAMFKHAIPMNKMLSYLAIYTVNNFLPSIGWVHDGWTQDGGAYQGPFQGFRTWTQESFEKSKREAKNAFMRFYHSNDPTYEDEESKGRKDEITRQKKPKPNNDPGLRWFRWKRKIRKPTDKNGKLCL